MHNHLFRGAVLILALVGPHAWGADNDPIMREAHRKAQDFIDHEKQFHLGVLPTEQSNPKTAGLAEAAAADLPRALRMLQSVDRDIVPAADAVFRGPAWNKLVASMAGAIEGRRRICFSGCGATGRLSILLEASWRQFWQNLRQAHPEVADRLPPWEDAVESIMTGGDYALIRSVENFEDYQVFGRRQVDQAQLGPGDVLVAISEGGETSSVIGTIWRAAERGSEVFFAFNNPPKILAEHIERSRQVIADPRVTVLDLSCGPMAVAGSTRMQATTSELLVVGAALETALQQCLARKLDAATLSRLGFQPAANYSAGFARLLDDLGTPASIEALAAMVAAEASLYGQGGRVTYLGDQCLLDIFTDTTERSPTFMLPRFRKFDDTSTPPPWACVKTPLVATPVAWRNLLRRAPRCLEWTAGDYRQMQAPEKLVQNPPALGAAEMAKFQIGCEDDPSRREVANAAILVALGDEVARLAQPADPLGQRYAEFAKPFALRAVLAIGPAAPPASLAEQAWHVPVRQLGSPLRLWDRLAVKLVLNTVSSATMARLGRLTSNWMSHVEPTNKKLIDRGTRLVAELAGVDYRAACYALFETIERQSREDWTGRAKPSPVSETIARLKAAK